MCFVQIKICNINKTMFVGGGCLTNSWPGREHLTSNKFKYGACKIWMIFKFHVKACSSLKPGFTGNGGSVNHVNSSSCMYFIDNYEVSISITIPRHKFIQNGLSLCQLLTHSLPNLVKFYYGTNLFLFSMTTGLKCMHTLLSMSIHCVDRQ
jgi:hypothetical protein